MLDNGQCNQEGLSVRGLLVLRCEFGRLSVDRVGLVALLCCMRRVEGGGIKVSSRYGRALREIEVRHSKRHCKDAVVLIYRRRCSLPRNSFLATLSSQL